MTQEQEPPEYVTIYRTAQEMLQSAKAWHPDARLMGNVKAGDIATACEFLIQSVEAFRFWKCPHGCRGKVAWTDGVLVCQLCGESSE